MQSLHISSSALRSVQYALDTTANNLANVDTVGYKRRTASFSELLFDSMEEQPAADRQRTSPPGLRIGSGIKLGMTKLDMSQGNMKTTDVPTDLMIEGEGFFLVTRRINDQNGNFLKEEFRLIRNGAFHLSASDPTNPTAPSYLVTAEGDILVDEYGVPIDFPSNGEFKVEADGNIIVDGSPTSKIPVWKIDNLDQYKQVGENEWLLELAPGQQPYGLYQQAPSTIRQGALEMSNVNLQQEMSQLILTQRAFQLNSRAIGISDQMMGIANSLRSR
jgi:flagellar basal-body rod protein FlgG